MTGSEELVRLSILTPRRRDQGVRGQSYVEFGLIASALILLVLGGIQLAMILNAALSVSQYSYAAARYASIHGSGQSASGYGATLKTNVSPPAAICTSGFGTCTTGSGLSTPTVTSSDPSGKIVSGAQLTVTVTYNLSTGGKIVVSNPFFGVTFPTSLSNATSMMAE